MAALACSPALQLPPEARAALLPWVRHVPTLGSCLWQGNGAGRPFLSPLVLLTGGLLGSSKEGCSPAPLVAYSWVMPWAFVLPPAAARGEAGQQYLHDRGDGPVPILAYLPLNAMCEPQLLQHGQPMVRRSWWLAGSWDLARRRVPSPAWAMSHPPGRCCR